jgi:amicoumacin kinase
MKNIPEGVRNEMAARFGMDPASLRLLGGGQDWSDGTLFTSGPLVLKILDLKASDSGAIQRVEDRVRFIHAFAKSGARVIVPRPSAAGRLYESVPEGDGLFIGYAYPFVAGRPIEAGDRIAHGGGFYRAMGELLGRLHAAAEAMGETLRPDGSSDACVSLKGWREEWGFFRSWCRDDEVAAAWEHLRGALERLPVDKRGYGFVHNDAHAGNLLLDPASPAALAGAEPGLTLIDFDVSNWHWFMCDSATALYSLLILAGRGIESEPGPPPGFRERAFGAFWEGYARRRDPGADWMERLDLFLQYRRCLLFMPFQDETAKHPAWRRRWKDAIQAEDRRLFR